MHCNFFASDPHIWDVAVEIKWPWFATKFFVCAQITHICNRAILQTYRDFDARSPQQIHSIGLAHYLWIWTRFCAVSLRNLWYTIATKQQSWRAVAASCKGLTNRKCRQNNDSVRSQFPLTDICSPICMWSECDTSKHVSHPTAWILTLVFGDIFNWTMNVVDFKSH